MRNGFLRETLTCLQKAQEKENKVSSVILKLYGKTFSVKQLYFLKEHLALLQDNENKKLGFQHPQ